MERKKSSLLFTSLRPLFCQKENFDEKIIFRRRRLDDRAIHYCAFFDAKFRKFHGDSHKQQKIEQEADNQSFVRRPWLLGWSAAFDNV